MEIQDMKIPISQMDFERERGKRDRQISKDEGCEKSELRSDRKRDEGKEI